MTSDKGNIYYTTDGSDPVVWSSSPAISPGALQYLKPLILSNSCHIKSRTFYNGEWSATTEQFFIFPENYNDLKITEIHYHPEDQGDVESKEYEFLELKNTGISTLDLGGLRFSEGIEFKFPSETYMRPNEIIVLASNHKRFYERYGFLPFNEFDGQLDSDGELILLIRAENDTLCSIFYEDGNGWPEAPDGSGKSLVPVDINPADDQNNPEFWRESYADGGSPGKDDIYIISTGTSSELATIYQNYPNPLKDATKLSYNLNEDVHIQMSVLNMSGQVVAVIEDTDKPAGFYQVEWDGRNENKSLLENGLYFCRIIVRNHTVTNTLTRKMLLIR